MSVVGYQYREKIDPKGLNRNGKRSITTRTVKCLKSRKNKINKILEIQPTELVNAIY